MSKDTDNPSANATAVPSDAPAIVPVRITVAVSMAVFIQSALGLIWAGSAAERITQLEMRTNDRTEQIERTTRLEEQVIAIQATLERIEVKLDAVRGER